MWFMNKIANPFVKFILVSPLHGLMSGTVLLLTYRGQRSNKAYTLPVQYVQSGKAIYIVPGMPEKKTWWRNLRGGAPVWVRLCGKTVTGRGLLLDPVNDIEEIITGLGLYLKRFPGLSNVRHLQAEPNGSFKISDLRQVAVSMLMVRVDLEN